MRTIQKLNRLMEAVQRQLAEDSDFGPDVKPGEWNLLVSKSRSRYSYTMVNPLGGSFGQGSYASAKDAEKAGLRQNDWGGKTRIWYVYRVWDPTIEDYVTQKALWIPVPKF